MDKKQLARQRSKKSYWKHRDKRLAKMRKWRKEHRDEYNASVYKWREKNYEHYLETKRQSYRKHKKRLLASHKIYREKIRKETLLKYGHKCICCGEKRYEFLAIDHVNNDGNEHRKVAGIGTAFCLWLKQNNFPNCVQVLCHNCNLAKQFYKRCPHQSP